MRIIPILPQPSQVLSVALGGQDCAINVYTKTGWGMFLDLAVNDVPIITGTLCLNAVPLVRDAYLGFLGDLIFYDTQGSDDPEYTGLGSRWTLAYIETTDVIATEPVPPAIPVP